MPADEKSHASSPSPRQGDLLAADKEIGALVSIDDEKQCAIAQIDARARTTLDNALRSIAPICESPVAPPHPL